jgi:hypothetical protein
MKATHIFPFGNFMEGKCTGRNVDIVVATYLVSGRFTTWGFGVSIELWCPVKILLLLLNPPYIAAVIITAWCSGWTVLSNKDLQCGNHEEQQQQKGCIKRNRRRAMILSPMALQSF